MTGAKQIDHNGILTTEGVLSWHAFGVEARETWDEAYLLVDDEDLWQDQKPKGHERGTEREDCRGRGDRWRKPVGGRGPTLCLRQKNRLYIRSGKK